MWWVNPQLWSKGDAEETEWSPWCAWNTATFLGEQSLWEFGHWTLLGLEAHPSLQRGLAAFCQEIAEHRKETLQQQLSYNQYLPLLESLCSTLNMQYSRAGSSSSQELGTPGKGCVCSSSELTTSFQKQPQLSWATVTSSVCLQQEIEAFCEWKRPGDDVSLLIN